MERALVVAEAFAKGHSMAEVEVASFSWFKFGTLEGKASAIRKERTQKDAIRSCFIFMAENLA